jgi:hypothetical protein
MRIFVLSLVALVSVSAVAHARPRYRSSSYRFSTPVVGRETYSTNSSAVAAQPVESYARSVETQRPLVIEPRQGIIPGCKDGKCHLRK